MPGRVSNSRANMANRNKGKGGASKRKAPARKKQVLFLYVVFVVLPLLKKLCYWIHVRSLYHRHYAKASFKFYYLKLNP